MLLLLLPFFLSPFSIGVFSFLTLLPVEQDVDSLPSTVNSMMTLKNAFPGSVKTSPTSTATSLCLRLRRRWVISMSQVRRRRRRIRRRKRWASPAVMKTKFSSSSMLVVVGNISLSSLVLKSLGSNSKSVPRTCQRSLLAVPL